MKTSAALLTTVLLLASSNVHAQANNPPAGAPEAKADAKPPQAPKPAVPDQGVRKLSRREKRDAMAKLTEKYRQFLKEVEPIMVPKELDTFLLLESDPQRDLYIEQFWARRDRDLRTGRNEYREQYAELVAEAQKLFRNLTTDRAKIYLTHGRPSGRVIVNNCRYTQPLDIWIYSYMPGLGSNTSLLFYQPRYGGDYKLWGQFASGDNALGDLLSGDAIGSSVSADNAARNIFGNNVVAFNCMEGRAIMAAISNARMNSLRLGQLFEPPPVEQEDIGKILRAAVISTPGATPLKGELAVKYPGKRGSRTAIDITISVPTAELTVRDVDGTRFYNVDVTGEILKDGKMFDNYRYRFDFPADGASATIPISVERFLRPAEYTARVKVTDVNSTAETIVEQKLSVPHVMEDPRRVEQQLAAAATLAQIQTEVRTGESHLRIVPLGDTILTGLQKIDTLVTGNEIQAVEFYLDNRKVMVKRNPPYSLELDFGRVPQHRKVKAVALDAKGNAIGGDELEFNTGTDPFRVRIVSPRVAMNIRGRLRVEVDAQPPDGKNIRSVELYLNENRLATLFDPPYVQTINVPDNLGIAYLRAVAHVDDPEIVPAEDVVFINSPEFIENVQVHLVELPTTVLDRNKPVIGLEQSAFRVLDEGKPVQITKFEYVKNVPLSLGLAIDSSGSMRDKMPEAQKAGAQFFRATMKAGDKAFVVSFDSKPLLLQKWSRQLSDLNAGLASLRAEESTALYDAIVFSLYQFQGVKGQKALVLITDGKDTASDFTFDQTLEYAKRSGVPLYAIGIGIRGTDVDAKSKLSRLASETGGTVYYIEDTGDLGRTYDEIQQELRSQYLIGFYPPGDVTPGGKWREVTVEAQGGKAKTIRGYYP